MPTPPAPPTTETTPTRGTTPAHAVPTTTPVTGGAGGATAPAPASTTPAPLTVRDALKAIGAKAPDVGDIGHALAGKLAAAGKTSQQFETEYADPNKLRSEAINAALDAGAAAAQTQLVGAPDPIARQKFSELDSERHLEDSSLVGTYYKLLAAEMRKPDFVDRKQTYEAMKRARPYSYCYRGKPIPASRLSRHATRNQSVTGLFNSAKSVYGAQIDAQVETELRARGVTSAAAIARAKTDEGLRRKAYRHLLAGGTPVKSTIDTSLPISSYGTWYHPMEVTTGQMAGSDNTVYSRMMRLGALQPEWYADGTVVLSIDHSLSRRARDARKPTVFDGLLSALWTSRNMTEDDYGLTGGGAAEFLEANVGWDEVTKAHAVIPTDDFLADIQRVASQVSNAKGSSDPTSELARGNDADTSILNTSPEVRGLYQDLLSDTTTEMNAPGATPTIPTASSPKGKSGMNPTGASAVATGPYDRTNGPRAGAISSNSASTDPRV